MSLTHLTRDALENARRSRGEITRSVTERRDLQSSLAELTHEECVELLEASSVGRLAYIARAGVVDIVPVNFRWYDGAALIRSGPGPKLQAAERREVVALEVDSLDVDSRTGWSVVVMGEARRVAPEVAGTFDLPETWAHGPRLHVVRVEPQRVTGRRLL